MPKLHLVAENPTAPSEPSFTSELLERASALVAPAGGSRVYDVKDATKIVALSTVSMGLFEEGGAHSDKRNEVAVPIFVQLVLLFIELRLEPEGIHFSPSDRVDIVADVVTICDIAKDAERLPALLAEGLRNYKLLWEASQSVPSVMEILKNIQAITTVFVSRGDDKTRDLLFQMYKALRGACN